MFVDPRLIGAALIALVMLGEGVAIWWYRDEAIETRAEFNVHLQEDKTDADKQKAETDAAIAKQALVAHQAQSQYRATSLTLDAVLERLRDFENLSGDDTLCVAGVQNSAVPAQASGSSRIDQAAPQRGCAGQALANALKDAAQCRELIRWMQVEGIAR